MNENVVIIDPSDWSSPLVASVTKTIFNTDGSTLMQPDCCWDFAVIRRGSFTQVLRTGVTSTAVTFEHAAGDEVLAIAFKPGTFMSLMPGQTMKDEGVVLEGIGSDRFRIGSDVLEIPRLENVDGFVNRLIQRSLVDVNPVVSSIAAGRAPAMSERTLQRHFLNTTGLTYKYFSQVQRAQKAMALIQQGRPAADVAFALGYSDQPHMIRSLKAIMGQTPTAIAAKVSN